VDSLLSQANERYERGYELKAQGYDLNRIARRVAELSGMEEHEVFSKGRQHQKVKARSLLCLWAVRELGMSLTDLARELEMSIPGVGYAVEKGESIVQDNKYQLIG
jgi:chromosomal replication initiation ATPase DnaA